MARASGRVAAAALVLLAVAAVAGLWRAQDVQAAEETTAEKTAATVAPAVRQGAETSAPAVTVAVGEGEDVGDAGDEGGVGVEGETDADEDVAEDDAQNEKEEEVKGTAVPPTTPEGESVNGTTGAGAYFPGDVVDVSANGTDVTVSASSANTAEVVNSTTAVTEGGDGDGEGGAKLPEVVPVDDSDPDAVVAPWRPSLIAPPEPGAPDTRCGVGPLARRQCREIDQLLATAIRNSSIGFNAHEEDLDGGEVAALVERPVWDALGSALAFSFCSLRSQHGRLTVAKRMQFTLQIVVDPAGADGTGPLSWQPVGLMPALLGNGTGTSGEESNSSGDGKTGDTSAAAVAAPKPVFAPCIQSDGATGFGTTRAEMNFSSLSGYSPGDFGVGALSNRSTQPEETINRLFLVACDRMRTRSQRTSCVVDERGQFETVQEVTATPAKLPERADVLLLGYQRALLAESSIAIVIAGLFLKDAAEAAAGEREGKLAKFLRFHILLALLIAIVSQSFFSLWDLYSRVQNFSRGYIDMTLDRAWVLSNGLWALEIKGSVNTIQSKVPVWAQLIVLPIVMYSLYLLFVYYMLAWPIYWKWTRAILRKLRRCCGFKGATEETKDIAAD